MCVGGGGEGDNVDTSRIANCRVQRLLGVEGTYDRTNFFRKFESMFVFVFYCVLYIV